MATDIDTQETISSGTSGSIESASMEEGAIELGSQLLHMLRQAAQAARLEAQVVQLTAALREARQGSPARLQMWLDRYQAGELDISRLDSSVTGRDSPVAGVDSLVAGLVRVQNTSLDRSRDRDPPDSNHNLAANGWEHYLQCARQRLANRKHQKPQQPVRENSSESCGDAIDLVPLRPSKESFLDCERLDDALPEDSLTSDASFDSALLDDHVDDDPNVLDAHAGDAHAGDKDDWNKSSSLSGESSVELSPAEEDYELELSGLDLGVSEPLGATQEPTVTRRRLGSMGFSLIGHSCLLLALGMMTYRAPSDAAALGSQVMSVESSSDNVEAGQEFELPEPLAMELPEPSTSSSMEKVPTDLSQLDQQLTAPLDASSLAMSSSMSSTASTLSAAVAAAANSGGGGNSGSAAGGKSGGPPTAGGKFFGVATGGNYFCYIVDSSGSMRGGAWESAKIELLRSLTSLKSTQRFYIIFFAKEIQAIPAPGSHEPAAYGLTATPENIDHARRWIDTVRLDRGGPPNDALELAIDRQPDAIYLLTDGVTSVDVCGFLREKNRVEDIFNGTQVRVPIHSIAYFSLDGQQLLRQIAQENDGQFHYVPKR